MYDAALCALRLDYELVVAAPLHVGAGEKPELYAGRRASAQQTKARGPDYDVTIGTTVPGSGAVALPVHRTTSNGRFDVWVPGPSIRGTLRHFLRHRFERALAGRAVDAAWQRDRIAQGVRDPREAAERTEPAWWNAEYGDVLIRHMFGSESRRGALEVGPAEVTPNRAAAVRYSSRASRVSGMQPNADLRLLTNNRLDRFTMASTQGLRNMAAIEVGTTLGGAFALQNFGWWQLGALYVAMDAFNRGAVGIGTRGGTGLGRVQLVPQRLAVRWHGAVAIETGRWPGIGQCLREPGSPWAAFVGGGAAGPPAPSSPDDVKMFVLDRDDVLSGVPAPRGQEASGQAEILGWQRRWSWDAAGAAAVMCQATARLAAVAEAVSSPRPSAPQE